MSEWIEAKQPLPRSPVLVTDGAMVTIAWGRDLSQFKRPVAPWMSWGGPRDGITHWMALPTPPIKD
jgi:hypothetical protein